MEENGALIYKPEKNDKMFVLVKKNEVLAIRDLILNKKGHYHFKGPGWRLVVPVLQEAELIPVKDIKNVPLKNKNHPDGKYRLNGGLGQDIELKVSIVYSSIENSKSLNKLLEQKETYMQATSTICEGILEEKLAQIIASKKRVLLDESKDENTLMADLKRELVSIDLDEIIERYLRTGKVDIYEAKIADFALKLKKEYGVHLSEIMITDVDLPENIKAIKEKENISAKERQLQELQAETDRKVAEKQAIAKNAEMKERIKILLEQGYSKEEILKMETIKNLPQNSVAVLNQSNDDNKISDIITGTAATKKLR